MSAWNRFASDLAGRVDVVLLLHRADDVGNSDSKFGELVRFYPQTHGVLAGTEYLHVGNSGYARQLVDQVNVSVVRQKNSVVGPLGRIQRDQHQRRGRRFLHRDAVVIHVGWQLRLRLRYAQLCQDLIDIRVRPDIEIDDHSHVAGVGVDRIHVIHVVDAAHLLLDRRRDRLLDRQCISTGVMRAHLDFRRRDLRILGDR